MKLDPWRRSVGVGSGMVDDLFSRIRETFGMPLAALESRLPEALRKGFPPVNLSETDTHFTVTAELPGLEESDIEVQVMGDQLVISGERRWREEKKDSEFHHVESQYGSFRRAVPLPPGLVTDADAVHAKYSKGILEVTFPRTEPKRPRRIAVEGG